MHPPITNTLIPCLECFVKSSLPAMSSERKHQMSTIYGILLMSMTQEYLFGHWS